MLSISLILFVGSITSMCLTSNKKGVQSIHFLYSVSNIVVPPYSIHFYHLPYLVKIDSNSYKEICTNQFVPTLMDNYQKEDPKNNFLFIYVLMSD